MVIEQLISSSVPTLLPSDTGSRALFLMEENNFTQLPLVKEEKYLALVTEHDVLDWESQESPLSKANFLQFSPAVHADGHPFEALRIAHQQNLSIVPVVDNENTYIGAITRENLLNYITENSGLDNPGGIIVLETDPRNYCLSQIARLCENEDVIIISSQVRNNTATGKFEITLKTNRSNLHPLASSFDRHDYTVIQVYGEESERENMLGRYNLLMNYINM